MIKVVRCLFNQKRLEILKTEEWEVKVNIEYEKIF